MSAVLGMMKEWPVVFDERNEEHIATVKLLLAAGADVNKPSGVDGWSALNLAYFCDDLDDLGGGSENPLQRLFLEANSSAATAQLKVVMEEFYDDGYYGVNYSCTTKLERNVAGGGGLDYHNVYVLETKETDPKGIRLKEAIMLLAEYGADEALEMQGSREERQVPEWARQAFALGADLRKVKATLKAGDPAMSASEALRQGLTSGISATSTSCHEDSWGNCTGCREHC